MDEYALCMPKEVAFIPGGYIDSTCNFELRKYEIKEDKVNMNEMEYVVDYPKDEIVKLLIKHLFINEM